MNTLARIIFIVLAAIFSSCAILHQKHDIPTSGFDAERMGKNIKQLSSDSFQGRKPFTVGENKTIHYLQDQFKSLKLEPGNGNSYFQKIPMVSITSVASAQILIRTSKGDLDLNGPDDYVIWSNSTDPVIELKQEELVFGGYGIIAPEYNWDDYTGIDVKNKIVMVLANEPGFDGSDTTIFKRDTMTYYARWTYKLEEAARQGAKGCLMIHSLKSTGQAFKFIQNGWNITRLRLDERRANMNQCPIAGWITEDAAKKLISVSTGGDTTLLSAAGKKGFKAKSLNAQLSALIFTKSEYNESHNVIAKITGSKQPGEYIIYTAHWDHLGVGIPDERGDSIYNGAHDNASGIAGLLELASAFKSLQKPPGRTIVFLALTAEEQGLWGSDWYVRNPVYPINKTLANINIDGLNPYEKTVDMIIVGQPQSQLEEILKKEAEKMRRTVAFDGAPGAGYYFRSDHFNFAKVGIPAIYAGSGSSVVGKEPGYGQKWKDEYGRKHYHRPSDEYNPATWTMEAAIEDLKLLFMLGKRIASEKEWPQWRDNSEFKLIRAKKAQSIFETEASSNSHIPH